METTPKHAECPAGRETRAGVSWKAWLAMPLLLTGLAGCGPEERSPEPREPDTLLQDLVSSNGMSINGLSSNGLSSNGLSSNGLSANGLSLNGLSSAAFSSWFQQDPSLADMVMRYLVRCAVASGETRSYTDPQTGLSWSWSGGLGLAPGWASGLPPTLAEQQVITACMMAHVNRFSESVTISVLGRSARGAVIPVTWTELRTWSVQEACFFGNLFTHQGLYFGVDRTVDDEHRYLTRACAGLGGGDDDGDEDELHGSSASCAPLTFVGSCWQKCTFDREALAYRNCTHNGVTYQPLITRMRRADYERLFSSSTGD
jgi:hypothetical protein